jgi:hypothetical protein
MAAGVTGEQRGERAEVQALLMLRGFQGAPEPLGVHDLGEIEHQSRDGSDRDPVDDRPVIGVKLAGDVAADAGAVTRRGGGHVDQPGRGWSQVPQRGAAAVAEHRVGSARQDRRHPASLGAQAGVTDGVHAAPETMKLRVVGSEVNLVARIPDRQQLCAGHDSVLTDGQRGELDLTW